MYLVLIQTSGNQSYIFGTNKLRENVGASQLTYEAGVKYVLQAVDGASGEPALWHEDAAQRRSALRRARRVEDGAPFEVIYAASGNALLIAQSSEIAKRLVSNVTRRALQEAPGLDVLGVTKELNWGGSAVLTEIASIYQEFERIRAHAADRSIRSLALPVAAKCGTSGLPAVQYIQYKDGNIEDISLESSVKRGASAKWHQRLRALFAQEPSTETLQIPENLDDLEQQLGADRWIAVAHADGNGLGHILQHFETYADVSSIATNRGYVNCLREFSLSIDEQAELAFLDAAAGLEPLGGGVTPIVPLLLGGDDLTVISSGSRALKFGCEYLKAFEHRTSALSGVRKAVLPRLTACIGIAIVKPHFPFHAAYDLAEELLRSAKQLKVEGRAQGRSGIDFHVLFDSTFTSLKAIRSRLQPPAVRGGRLTAKPYVVSHETNTAPATEWSRAHDIGVLEKRIKGLTRQVDGESAFGRGQLHALRTAFFESSDAAEAYWNLISHRYPTVVSELEESNHSLFRARVEADGERETVLLDAMEIARELWPSEEKSHV